MLVRAIVLAVLSLHSSTGGAADSTRTTVLSELQLAFQDARALPLGSRPSPPLDVDIDSLVGAHLGLIRASLGTPDYEGDDLLNCDATQCWAFEYGPEPEPPLTRDRGDGRTDIVIRTGGPWLLLLAIENDSVTAARWRGQR